MPILCPWKALSAPVTYSPSRLRLGLEDPRHQVRPMELDEFLDADLGRKDQFGNVWKLKASVNANAMRCSEFRWAPMGAASFGPHRIVEFRM